MTIYAIKKPEGKDRVQQIFDSLEKGESRFGWSSVETADMRELKERVQQHGWSNLTAKEADCYHEFLLEVNLATMLCTSTFPNGVTARWLE